MGAEPNDGLRAPKRVAFSAMHARDAPEGDAVLPFGLNLLPESLDWPLEEPRRGLEHPVSEGRGGQFRLLFRVAEVFDEVPGYGRNTPDALTRRPIGLGPEPVKDLSEEVTGIRPTPL